MMSDRDALSRVYALIQGYGYNWDDAHQGETQEATDTDWVAQVQLGLDTKQLDRVRWIVGLLEMHVADHRQLWKDSQPEEVIPLEFTSFDALSPWLHDHPWLRAFFPHLQHTPEAYAACLSDYEDPCATDPRALPAQ